ncbi:TetR/AcrR family transcriptional regulator [soil metagenome]
MATSTFLNLEENKQREILNVAYQEFALNSYEKASLSLIVKNLAIAKGSFYRFFDSKLELYKYLIEDANRIRDEQVKKELNLPINNIIDLFNERLLILLNFDLVYPLYSGFLYNVFMENNHEELGNIMLDTKKNMVTEVKKVIKNQLITGTIRDDLDLDLISYMVVQVQIGIYDYLTIKYKISFREAIKDGKPLFSIPASELMLTVKSFLNLVLSGLTYKAKGETMILDIKKIKTKITS